MTVTVPLAYVAGVPVEELLPVAVTWVAAAGASLRHKLAAHKPPRELPPVQRPEDLH